MEPDAAPNPVVATTSLDEFVGVGDGINGAEAPTGEGVGGTTTGVEGCKATLDIVRFTGVV